jgi:hypothetical protein
MTKERGSKGSKGLKKETVKDLDAPAEKAGGVKGGAGTPPVRHTLANPTPPVKPSPLTRIPRK